jgi:hypothetical protein
MSRFDSPGRARRCVRSRATSVHLAPGARASSRISIPEALPALDQNPTALCGRAFRRGARGARPPRAPRAPRAGARARRGRETGHAARGGNGSRTSGSTSRTSPASSGSTGASRSTRRSRRASGTTQSASDLGVPPSASALFYREGYFRQQLRRDRLATRALSRERPGTTATLAEKVSAVVDLADDSGAVVPVRVQVWRAEVGRVPSTCSTPTSTATRLGTDDHRQALRRRPGTPAQAGARARPRRRTRAARLRVDRRCST